MITASRLHTRTPAGPATLWRVMLALGPSPREVLARLEGERLPFALTGSWAGGGAVLGSEPVVVADDHDDPFATLDYLPDIGGIEAADAQAGVIGGGWFGWLGFRLGSRIERLPPGPPRPVAMPEFHLAFYDHVLRLDPAGEWWFEALATSERETALQERLDHLRELLAAPDVAARAPAGVGPLRLASAAADDHLDAVAQGVRRIAAGEIFQANLCVRLESRTKRTATGLYLDGLGRARPAYGATFDTPGGGIASLSPELFLRRRGREVITAPIKGTIPRPDDPSGAASSLATLRRSAKDAAEHVMIVDLMRNDLGRVCTYGTIEAAAVPEAHAQPGLWHLVSQVRGRLRPGVSDAELLRATFAPGSVTGAPKVQALHVIAALEATSREVYTGAIGYASPVAGLELSVAIRTLELHDGALWLGAGGGVVADSDPRAELEEALAKARPVAAAIGSTVVLAGAR